MPPEEIAPMMTPDEVTETRTQTLARMRRMFDTGPFAHRHSARILYEANAKCLADLATVEPRACGDEWSPDVERILGGSRADYAAAGRRMVEAMARGEASSLILPGRA